MALDYTRMNTAEKLARDFLTRVWGPEHDIDSIDELLDVFANPSGDRVVARWVNRGRNNGVFGLPPDGRAIEFHGISVWRVRDGRLAECWVEREPPRYRQG